MTKLEEAAKCPKCEELGRVGATQQVFNVQTRETDDLVEYMCVTEVCPWFDTGWLVQSSPTGEIAERDRGPRGMDKTFMRPSPEQLAYGRAVVEEVMGRDVEEDPEIRNPHG